MSDRRPDQDGPRRPLFTHEHRKRSLSRWIIPLAVILAVIYFLPRLMAILLPE